SIFSMAGDLTASKIKREYGIKDFGKLLPGHGGIMDRFDSVLFVAPAVYYFVLHFL
ncbi:MAG TPA: phosphatidate cytidylyltransferase, partial [Tissierellia bacterium]|nr:phosphatidate cytidylyltransferase [Tissierellia bacterium]